MRVNIIGGGLAGCSLAYILKNLGAEPVIYEASSCLAADASGNDVGLYNPRLSAHFDGMAKFYSDGFFQALDIFEDFGDAIDWNPCGVLTLMTDERAMKRLRKTISNWGWSDDDMYLVNALESSDISGVEINDECLYIPRSGSISPRKICHEYTRGVEVHLNHPVDILDDLEGDVSVLACGISCLKFKESSDIPLKTVRGQVSYIAQTEGTKNLKVALSYGGHFSPSVNGVHCVGATFQPWDKRTDLRDEDDLSNLDKMFSALPAMRGSYDIVKRRAAMRTTSRDHFPVVGQLCDNVYISTGHGSYGILSTIISAKILSNTIVGGGYKASEEVLNALSFKRFS
ncbi:MAG: FAD-dependent 5-carboxymethylaminomethyl-2-thiouridine(34) oxidoreductase MnmC [Alphaproteobacteria bacterium]